MALLAITLVMLVAVLVVTSRKRFEDALPYFVFFLIVLPGAEAKIVIPGLFDVTTVRIELIALLVLYFVRPKRGKNKRVPLMWLMFAHAAWASFSTFFSLAVATSIKQVIAQVLEYYLVYYILVKSISEVQTIYKIAFAAVIAMAVCSIFGMFEAYLNWSVISLLPSDLWLTYGSNSPLYLEEGRGLRIRSTFPHPILFGDALAMTIPLALYLLSIWKERRQKIALQVAVPLMFWAVYKTSSRGPWIATALSLLLLAVLVQNKVRRYIAILAILTILTLVVRPGIWDTISNLYRATQDTSSSIGSSYEYRYIVSDAVIQAVGSDSGRAIFGFGLGTFRQVGLNIHFLGEVRPWYTCDNNWVLFLYETGYVGLFIIALLLFRALALTFKAYWHLPRPDRYLNAALTIGVASFYLGLASVAGYSWGQQAYMVWIFIALAFVNGNLAGRKTSRQTETAVPETTPYELPVAAAWRTDSIAPSLQQVAKDSR